MTREEAEKIATNCYYAHGDENEIIDSITAALLEATREDLAPRDEPDKPRHANMIEDYRERALKAEHAQRRAQAETAVHRMFVMKTATRLTDPAILARDADTLLETGPAIMAEKMLGELDDMLTTLKKVEEILGNAKPAERAEAMARCFDLVTGVLGNVT